ncbi:hypothetical protein LB553_01175 [Mesorhizobium sp. CA8]|uniref:hypothetical protein n=1 Tax=Mesorhizobium sp. CA8 TaxID=2876637 RepID=UPI001CC91C72|nr:hypothetical protein [Mesorhizobium sp. CA8]MBZ9759498.1 hypothetical protein [Mesorhizobium sp. CA8]
MPATVGSISIDLSTNAAKFATGFKSAATTVESQSARMAKSVAAVEVGVNRIGGTLKTFLGGLAAGAGIAALGSLGGAFDKLKETISQFDEIATNAKTVGLNTDAYQAFAFAAKQANIDQASFNSSLSIFAKNAGLAQKGTGALFASLSKLNPELLRNILSTTDQEKRLDAVADAMARTKDATQQAALATAVFGKGGVEMARILDGGRKQLEQFKQSAKEMGIIIPNDLLQRAGELDDKLDALQAIISSQLSQAVINLAPVLVKTTGAFATFSQEVNTLSGNLDKFVQNPSLETFRKFIGAPDTSQGSLLDYLERFNKYLANAPLANAMRDTFDTTNDEQIQAIKANIEYVESLLDNLHQAAAQGQDVHLEIADAEAKLKRLQDDLAATGAAGVSAANDIRAAFAQAFREAENASMAALAAFRKEGGTAVPLPTVTRYGAPASSITPGSTYQTDVNGSGVSVRKYGGTSLSPTGDRTEQTDVNGSGVNVTKYSSATADNTKDTAGYTHDTADNIDKLDQNTRGYFRDLSNDIGGYTSRQIDAIGGLGNSISSQLDTLDAITAQMVAEGLNSGNISQPSSMFGDQWDPQHGSHVGGIINTGLRHSGGNVGHFRLPSYADDGSSNNQVSVAQPGSDITLNYYAAPGESTETAKQRAREMFNELVLQASRA